MISVQAICPAHKWWSLDDGRINPPPSIKHLPSPQDSVGRSILIMPAKVQRYLISAPETQLKGITCLERVLAALRFPVVDLQTSCCVHLELMVEGKPG